MSDLQLLKSFKWKIIYSRFKLRLLNFQFSAKIAFEIVTTYNICGSVLNTNKTCLFVDVEIVSTVAFRPCLKIINDNTMTTRGISTVVLRICKPVL